MVWTRREKVWAWSIVGTIFCIAAAYLVYGMYRVAELRATIDWVSIPAGTYTMGSPEGEVSDEPQHQVTLSAFKMSKYEVTFEQYDAFCDATGKEKPDDEGWGRGKRPAINISWDDATRFAEWLGCRLPTEAEWEYACRAGTTTPFNTGNKITTAQANCVGFYDEKLEQFEGEYREKTIPVGSFAPNAWGLYDMHGNVCEYCSDYWGDYPRSAQTHPKGPAWHSSNMHVVRGGSWKASEYECRSAARAYHSYDIYINDVGFRLVSPR